MKKTTISLFAFVIYITGFNLFAEESRTLTLAQTVQIKSVGQSTISPDGKYIAYTLNIPREVYKAKDGGRYAELHVVNQQGESRQFITGKVNVSAIQWDKKSHFIYYLAKRNDDKYKSVYRIAVDGGESEKIVSTNADINAYTLNHSDQKLVYLAKKKKDKHDKKLKEKGFNAKIYEESVENTLIYQVDLTNLEKQHEKILLDWHVISAEFHPKKDQLLLQVAPSSLIDDQYTKSQYKIFDLAGKQKVHFKSTGKLGAAQWSKDGKYVAFIGAVDKNDPAAGRLFVGDVKSGRISEPVKNYMGHVKGVQWLSDFELAYLGHVGTQSEVAVVNIDSGNIKTKVPAGEVVITSLDSDSSGKALIGVGSSDKYPAEVFELSSGKNSRLTVTNPQLSKIKLPEQQTITYKARDGLDLQGVLIYPLNYKKKKRYPLIMMVHGGPESHISDAWLDRYSYPVKYAAEQGFAVFLPNYRGSTGRGVEFSKLGQADYAGAEFNDLVDAITHLSDIGLVDKKRVGITGGSYGGYASAWGATALSEHFAASVMFVGIANQLSKFGTTDIPQEMHDVHARNYPWERWQWMLERSPIFHTDKAKTPLLILHGEKDTRVHPSQSMELYRYIKTRTDTPVRLVLYPNEPHGNRRVAAQLDYSMRLMRWMSFYLQGDNKGKAIPPYQIQHIDEIKRLEKED
ncbi:alpha/beta hydrolase family protein [Aliikangiella maris]|uniref:S9 family peptidase n=2 Tax=Aliikangiella maris TaxID=3162458 RepID=A0ABV2BV02_9GAMM